jgi:putative ABC transport system substrate-binding protein
MKEKAIVLTVCAMLLAFCGFARAQQATKKVPIIGTLHTDSPSSVKASYDAFRQGLRDLGYVEG